MLAARLADVDDDGGDVDIEAEARRETVRAPSAAAREPAPSGAARRRPEQDEGSVAQRVLASSAFRGMMRSAATVIGREVTRSVLGVGRRRRRRRR